MDAHQRAENRLIAERIARELGGRVNMIERLLNFRAVGHTMSQHEYEQAILACFCGGAMPNVLRKGNPWPDSRKLDRERVPA